MGSMNRRFLAVTVCLTATVAFLIGLIVAGSMTPQPAVSSPTEHAPLPTRARTASSTAAAPATTPSFADVAERLNPAVVNIDATSRGSTRSRRPGALPLPDGPDLFDRPGDRDPQGPRRGAGTGFIIDPQGLILTNHHVVDGADRIMVRLTDGRNLHATRVGSDPDTDIALIKVESARPLPYAPLGDSDALRVGEWVVAIGNPLAYEHTVTVGVVSFIGRKLFDSSLDRYIQTDAAINFGNSGGPLINARGEVIGINAAISSRAANIGFAVPINQARAILPQLRDKGQVSRGYIGVALRDVDPDLQRSLGLKTSHGALVQDITAGSPGARGHPHLRPDCRRRRQARQRQRPAHSADRVAPAGQRRLAADPARQPCDERLGEAGRAATAREARDGRRPGAAAVEPARPGTGPVGARARSRLRPALQAAGRHAGRGHLARGSDEPGVRRGDRARARAARNQPSSRAIGGRLPPAHGGARARATSSRSTCTSRKAISACCTRSRSNSVA